MEGCLFPRARAGGRVGKGKVRQNSTTRTTERDKKIKNRTHVHEQREAGGPQTPKYQGLYWYTGGFLRENRGNGKPRYTAVFRSRTELFCVSVPSPVRSTGSYRMIPVVGSTECCTISYKNWSKLKQTQYNKRHHYLVVIDPQTSD